MQRIRVNNLSPSTTSLFFFICLVALCVSPAFALGAGARNILLIGLMGIAPFFFIVYPVWSKIDCLLALLVTTTISFPLLGHPATMRYSTVLYTCMFFLYFMVIYRLLYFSDVGVESYAKFLKTLIYAYFIVLVIQQFCVLLGLPVFNVSNYNPLEPWKLNSLMSEPEHSGRMMALLMFSFLTMQDGACGRRLLFLESWQKDKFVWIAFLWSMLTMVSAGAYLFLFIVLLKFFNKKQLVPFVCGVACFAFVGIALEIKPFMRVYKLVAAMFTFDVWEMYRADQSGALRFVPSLICIEKMDLSTWDGWFGAGVDYVKTFMSGYLPGVNKGYVGGGSFMFALEYGFINFLMYILFSFYACYDKENKLTSIAFWVFSVLLSGINLQLTWSTITILYCNRQIKKAETLQNKEKLWIKTSLF